MTTPQFRQGAPMGARHRISSDSVWPLRCADGRTFAQRKADKETKPCKS